MDKIKFYKGINKLILGGEMLYFLIFGLAFITAYSRNSDQAFGPYLLLTIIILYLISTIRYYLSIRSMKYEDYFNEAGEAKNISTKNYKSPFDKAFYIIAVVLGIILGLSLWWEIK